MLLIVYLDLVFSVGLDFNNHVPDDNSRFSCRGDNSGNASFLKVDSLEERGQFVVFLIADRIGGVTEGFGDIVFPRMGTVANDLASTDFVIGHQAQPAGKAFGSWKLMDVMPHTGQ